MKFNDVIQWLGAVFVIAMYSATAIGIRAYPFTLIFAALGIICFATWSWRVNNRPQLLVNTVAGLVIASGIYRYFG